MSIGNIAPASVELSLTTDFQGDTGCPETSLRAIAEAGFTHVHWCHQWNTDFLYGPAEISQIGSWLREFGLKLLDLHGSAGREKCWWSGRESERLAGVELVENRLRMTAELGGSSVVMHVPQLPAGMESAPDCDRVRRSVDALLPVIRRVGVRLAFENMGDDDFRFLRQLLGEYGTDAVGICYDCGHGNLREGLGLSHLETVKDRLIAVHLHDNDGAKDRHWVPFTGSVDFARLAGILASSSYKGCISMESNVNNVAEAARGRFTADAYQAGLRLHAMVVEERGR